MNTSARKKNWIAFIHEHRFFILLIVVFLMLAIYYNLTLPVGESDHEASHYRYILYIKEHWRRPPPNFVWPAIPTSNACEDSGDSSSGEWQFTQPPSYYFLAAATFFWFHNDEAWWPDPNPYTTLAGLRPGGGSNVLVHKPDETIFSHRTVLEVHTYRFFSTILGMFGVLGVYLLGLALFDQNRKLATLLSAGVALVPMYITSSSVIGNDILVGVLGIYSIYFFFKSVKGRHYVLWGLLGLLFFILAMISKYTFFILFPVLGMALLFSIFRMIKDRKNGAAIGGWVFIIGIELLIFFGGPWLFLTRVGAGGLSQRYVFLNLPITSLVQSLFESLSNPSLLSDAIVFSFSSYWGLFGADAIPLPDWMVAIFLVFSLFAAVGIIIVFVRSRFEKSIRYAILVSVLILIIDWLLFLAFSKQGARGRYMLALYPLVSLLMITGTSVYRYRKSGPLLTYLFVATLFIISVLIPPLAIKPSFTPPPVNETPEQESEAFPVHATFGDLVELISLDIEPKDITPGDIVTVRMIWRVLGETDNNYTVGVHLEDGNHQFIAGIAHFPANGRYATSLWRPGDIFEDTYQIQTFPKIGSELPTGGYIKITMYCPNAEGDKYLPVKDAEGNLIGDAVYSPRVRIGLPVSTPPPDARSILGDFGGELALVDVQGVPEEFHGPTELTLSTTWQALKRPSRDYTLSVQVIDEQKNVVIGNDAPLTHGYYPSDLWPPNEKVQHEQTLQIPLLPSGEYRLIMSLYDAEDGTPLILSVDSPRFTPEGYLLAEWEQPHQLYRYYFPIFVFQKPFGK